MSVFCTILLLFWGLAFDVSGESKFLYPGEYLEFNDDPTQFLRFEVGDTITIEWETSFSPVDILLHAEYLGMNSKTDVWTFTRILDGSPGTSADWVVNFENVNNTGKSLRTNEDGIFWLGLYKKGTGSFDSRSRFFNISNEELDYAIRTSTISTSPTTTTTDISATTSSAASDKSGLSTGAAAGIGVAATLGALAILAILGFCIWRRKRRSQAVQTETQSQSYHGDGGVERTNYQKAELESRSLPAQLE